MLANTSRLRLRAATCMSRLEALRLSFECKEDEAAFLSWHETNLLTSMFRSLAGLAVIAFLYSLLELTFLRLDLGSCVNDFGIDLTGPRILTISAGFAYSLACGVCCAYIWASRRWECVSGVDVEALFVACMICFAVTSGLVNRESSAELFGLDPSDVWGQRVSLAMTNVPLLACLNVTYACTSIPIRFQRALLLSVVNVLVVALRSGLSGHLADGGVATVLLFCIIIASLLRSAWYNEQRARANWQADQVVQESLRTVQRMSEEIHQKDEEINEQREEIREHMHGVLPDLPGQLPAPPPRSRTPSHDGSRLRPRRGGPSRAGNLSGALDGMWRCRDPPRDMSNWLRYLHIKGPRIIDGEGRTCLLHQAADGSVIFEGGTLCITDGMLIRKGKQSVLTFASVPLSVGDADIDDTGSESDRESYFQDLG